MSRQTDERKAFTALASHLKAIDWNPSHFAVVVMYAHGAIQKRLMETFLHCVDVWAEEYLKGTFSGDTRYVCEVSNEIRNLVRALYDEEKFPPTL